MILVCLIFIIGQVWLDLTMPDYMSEITTLVQTEGSAMSEIWLAGGNMLLCALGMPIYCILDNIPMIEMPKFIGCLFAGAIARNVMEAAHIKFYTPEVDALEHMFLELFLALVLMTIDITALADVAGQMGIFLLLQAAIMALFAIFVSYNMFGRNYGAAVMAAGNCGWGCGSGPNAVANEKAVMDQYGWHNVAWVLYPSFAVIIDDIYNPIFLSVFGGLLAH